MSDTKIFRNKELNIWEALIPVFVLVAMLAYNVYIFGEDAISGSNQFILLMGAAVASIIGYFNKVNFKVQLEHVSSNIKSVTSAILILLAVGALVAAWLISGVIPAMVYYGLKLINPVIFLPIAVIISAIISLATGSSWTTTGTIGVALVVIGKSIGLPSGMVAGAVISGAYFGDKMSPMSDTTNLAASMAGTNLFTHIKYMSYTTLPSFLITLVVFTILSFTQDVGSLEGVDSLLLAISSSFFISPWLFLVPLAVIVLIVKKTHPLIALLVGILLGTIFSLIFQIDVLISLIGKDNIHAHNLYKLLMHTITAGVNIETGNITLDKEGLFSVGGMKGMLGTIWLIICAMVYGGIMEAIGALSRISQALLNMANSVFGLFASTVASCLALNVTASDQYLAIVVPGKMFEKAYKDKGLAPENLSRTLEDSGTVTSVLVPWNTCGAYQSGVLGVGVGEFFIYAVFNYVSPFMTLLFAAFKIKIKQLNTKSS